MLDTKQQSSTKVIILSDKMLDKLSKINHFISKSLIDLHKKKEALNIKFSYIDISNENGMVSYLSTNKEVDFKTGKEILDNEKWIIKSRTNVRVGAVIRSVLEAKNIKFSDSDIEDFSNKFRSAESQYRFELVKGNDIKKWYNFTNYASDINGSSLNGSCMRHKECGNFLSIYTKNDNVSMLVCIDRNEKLLSRAIVWYNTIIGKVKNQTYVDRIYCYDDRFLSTVKDYIHSKGWWCKERQSNDSFALNNGKTILNNPNIKVNIPLLNWLSLKKPYMDTMKYLKEDLVDGQLVLYLGNKDGKSVEYWTATNGSSNENYGYDSILKRLNVLSKHFDVKLGSVRFEDDVFLIKNKKYSLAKYNGQLSKFVKDNIDCLSEIDFAKFIPPKALIQEHVNSIYQAYSKRIDKYVSQRLCMNQLNSKIFYKFLVDILSEGKNADKFINVLDRKIKERNSYCERHKYSSFSSYGSYNYSYNSPYNSPYPLLGIDKDDIDKVEKLINYTKKQNFAQMCAIEFLNKIVCVDDIIGMVDKKVILNLKVQAINYIFDNGITMGMLKTIFNTENTNTIFKKVKDVINIKHIDVDVLDNQSIAKLINKMGGELISQKGRDNYITKYILKEIDKKVKSKSKKIVKKAVKKKVLK